MTKQTRGILRQGDVLLVPVDTIPKTAKSVKPVNGLFTVALGEATLHHHSIPVLDRPGAAPRDIEAFTAQDGVDIANAMDVWLRVGSEGATITHQEHTALEIPAGFYRVCRPQEYTAQGLQRVAD